MIDPILYLIAFLVIVILVLAHKIVELSQDKDYAVEMERIYKNTIAIQKQTISLLETKLNK